METTQQASEPPIKAPYFGEPWKATAVSRIEDRDGYWQADTRNNDQRDRIIACVNACAGMADPAKEIQVMRVAIQNAAAAFDAIILSFDDEATWVTRDVPANAIAKLQPFLPNP
jgi:hypothetical protein